MAELPGAGALGMMITFATAPDIYGTGFDAPDNTGFTASPFTTLTNPVATVTSSEAILTVSASQNDSQNGSNAQENAATPASAPEVTPLSVSFSAEIALSSISSTSAVPELNGGGSITALRTQASAHTSTFTANVPLPSTPSYDNGSSKNIAVPVVCAVIPLAFAVTGFSLFCWWFKKKRERDRQLDDLERSAVWPTRSEVSVSNIKGSKIQQDGQGDPIMLHHDPSDHCSNKSYVTSVNSASSLVPGADALNFNLTTASQASASGRNPFTTPSSDDEDDQHLVVGRSQIGLAITTSIHSVASSGSVATVIRHTPQNSGGSSRSSSACSSNVDTAPTEGEVH